MKHLWVTPEFKLFTVVGLLVIFMSALAHLSPVRPQTKAVIGPSSITGTASEKAAYPSYFFSRYLKTETCAKNKSHEIAGSREG